MFSAESQSADDPDGGYPGGKESIAVVVVAVTVKTTTATEFPFGILNGSRGWCSFSSTARARRPGKLVCSPSGCHGDQHPDQPVVGAVDTAVSEEPDSAFKREAAR